MQKEIKRLNEITREEKKSSLFVSLISFLLLLPF